MRTASATLAAAVLAVGATVGESAPKPFAEVLSEVRKASVDHKKVAKEVGKGDAKSGPNLRDVFMTAAQMRIDLAEACGRTGRHLTKDGSLYFEKKALVALGWKFEDPPDEEKPNPVAVRARVPELVARRTPTGAAEPDVVVTIDAFTHKTPSATNKKEAETYPFPGIGREVVCSDVAALLQAHVDEWKLGCEDTGGGAVAVAKKSVGIGDWFASISAKVKGEERQGRREWYAWTGEPFKFLHHGGTFVLTATYTWSAATDPRAFEQVQALLKALQPTLK